MEQTERKNPLWELLKFSIIAAIIVIPFRIFIAQPFIVSGASMDPTFHNGDYLIVDQLTHRFDELERGSVIIFKYPRDPKNYFIKRVVGLPNETVSIENGRVFVFSEKNPNGFILEEDYIFLPDTNSNEAITLGADEYFVMGDNRKASSDSRIWGPLNKSFIVGRPLIQLFPLGKVSLFPGSNK